MRQPRRLGTALALAALAVITAGILAWQLMQTPRVAIGPLSVEIPASCAREVHESGDAGAAVVLLYLPGSADAACLGLQERSESIEELVARTLDAAGASASTEPDYGTPCGPATRIRDGARTIYFLRGGGSSWIVSFHVPYDTMATCAMAS